MEIYYVYGGTSNTIIIATDGAKAVEPDEITPGELGGPEPLTNDDVLYIINHRDKALPFWRGFSVAIIQSLSDPVFSRSGAFWSL